MTPGQENTENELTKVPWKWLIALASVALGLLAFRGGELSAAKDEIKIEFPEPGTTLVTVNNIPNKASYLLAASDLWAPTGLPLNPGQSVKITASGRANLGIHRLVEAAHNDTYPTVGWTGPAGVPVNNRDVRNTYRQDLKIEPRAGDGTLLAYFHQSGKPEPSLENPLRGEAIVVGASGTIKNNNEVPVTIWLVINDAVLENSEKSRSAFVAPDNTDTSATEKIAEGPSAAERWRYIQQKQYWNLWFDDNVGFYQVQFDFQSEQSQQQN
ncbi:hypothetical protein [Trichocoleus sp. FACHB-262]|uniref:hypothetical protein n=1 Tax=Trichocoleus sp. FACHB-262 TaxID=2692869 RepID=UPI0016896C9F|nr:hypothetical protein [Trichocoleus sp. FACHB-262]MBD2123407.1 hypothetical protein [Trichocoleus sp. FACHB-262]